MSTDPDDKRPSSFKPYVQCNKIEPNVFDERKAINILLLGETGVGKSTFINSFANYLTHETLEEAEEEDIISLIPSTFIIYDENYTERKVSLGFDENESTDPGKSCTQKCKCYSFAIKDGFFIRLIDTPGVGDTSGIEQDKSNFENILAFIGQYRELHCICMLFKPNNSKITVSFEFCFKQLLCHLEKSANRNIVFLFTNARSTFYNPGDTVTPLRKLLNDLSNTHPYVNIRFDRETIYCLDNEAFRFLVALKNDIRFTDDKVTNFSNSWSIAAKECIRLLNYIIGADGKPGLTPHLVQNTLSVNEARRQILDLSQPLADIIQNIQDNLNILENHMDYIQANSDNIKELQQKISIPYIDLEIIELDYPKTVCSSRDCIKTYKVLGVTKVDYVQICHRKCILKERVFKKRYEVSLLRFCWAMDWWGKCRICPSRCGYEKHLHIFYDTKAVAKQIEDDSVKEEIKDKESAQKFVELEIEKIKKRCADNRIEVNTITRNQAKFAHFLRNNAIAPYNDSFKDYVEHLIENEKINFKGKSNSDKMSQLKDILIEYDKEKEILDIALTNATDYGTVTALDVKILIKELYGLEINGKKIKESQEKLQRARSSAHFSFQNEYYFVPKKFAKKFENQCKWALDKKDRLIQKAKGITGLHISSSNK